MNQEKLRENNKNKWKPLKTLETIWRQILVRKRRLDLNTSSPNRLRGTSLATNWNTEHRLIGIHFIISTEIMAHFKSKTGFIFAEESIRRKASRLQNSSQLKSSGKRPTWLLSPIEDPILPWVERLQWWSAQEAGTWTIWLFLNST